MIVKQALTFLNSDWKHVSLDAKDFIKRLLIKNPAERMTISEALQHKWLRT
jgi:serine/threonine protein kinase